MSRYPTVGVANIGTNNLKQLSLLYDQILIAENYFHPINDIFIKQHYVSSDWLVQENILIDVEEYIPIPQYPIDSIGMSSETKDLRDFANIKDEHMIKIFSEIHSLYLKNNQNLLMEFLSNPNLLSSFATRMVSVYFRSLFELNTFPIISSSNNLVSIDEVANKSTIINIVLNEFPFIDEDTPWERIVDFRLDEDAKNKLLELKVWMNKLTREKYTLVEVSEELEYLINKYSQYIEYHKIKYQKGKFEVFIKTIAGIAEDILKLRIERLVDRFFEVRSKRAALLEAELRAPAQEIAYIFHAQKFFS